MPAKSKIKGDLENTVRELCEKGYNFTHIGKLVNLAKDTVKLWAIKNGYSVPARISSRTVDLEPQIVEALKANKSRKQIQKSLSVHYQIVTDIAKKHGLENKLRTRAVAALDKVLTFDEATSRLPAGSGTVIGYNPKKSKYVIQTQDGHVYFKTSAKLFQGDPRNKSGHILTELEVLQRLSKIGYAYSGGFTNTHLNFKAVHIECGSIRETRLLNFFCQGCPTCGNNCTSNAESDLLEWVKEHYPSAHKYKFKERATRPKEIDIYIPELNLGIEFCGFYWHSEELECPKDNKHYKKMLQAEKEGIRLITIFENEWIERRKQVKNFLLSAMNKNQTRIFARKCLVKEIDHSVARAFFEENHTQGDSSVPEICFGLFYQGEMVGAINGGLHPQVSRPNSESLYLNRMAFKGGVSVAGGSSKLFSALSKYAKGSGYSRIVSWSDNRWSQGKVYTALGFKLESQRDKGRGLKDGSVWPDFYYVIGGELCTRAKAKGLGIDLGNAKKIYDCGKKRWVFVI